MDFLRWARIHWDRVVAVAAALAGAVALFLGWNGASQTAFPAEQLPYLLSGGLVGLFLFGAGATLWLSADLRDEWGELRGIREELRAGRVGADGDASEVDRIADVSEAGRRADGSEANCNADVSEHNHFAAATTVTELARSKRA
jgi:hypothetical protein